MANLPDITFQISSSGLGRPLDGKDHYSGMVFYSASYPSGFSSSNKINKVFSIEDVEALGIKGDYSNETKATGGNFAVSITSAGVGDTVEFKVTALGVTTSLGVATWDASMSTVALFATAARTAINTLTSIHGFVAGGTGGNVLLTPPAGYGSNINGAAILTTTIVGTITAPTVTNFSGGVNDPFINIWYHCKRYFLRNPQGVLWLGIFPTSGGSLNFQELNTMQAYAGGEIRIMGVFSNYSGTAFATSQVTTLQAVATVLDTEHTPIDIVYTPLISSGTALSALPDLTALTAKNVMVDIAQDGANLGLELYTYLGTSIGSLGCTLGTLSSAKVSDSIAWVAKYNVANNDSEFIVPAFTNGVKYRDQSVSLITSLYSYNYTFLKTHVGISGTYYVGSQTAIANTSDYSTIENNRTINKAIRNVRTALLPQLSAPVYVDATTGKLTNDYVGYITELANAPLIQMAKDGELNGHVVIINPDQDVLSSGKIEITIKNVPVGVSKYFSINIGYTTKI